MRPHDCWRTRKIADALTEDRYPDLSVYGRRRPKRLSAAEFTERQLETE
jgi:hypothetical protein